MSKLKTAPAEPVADEDLAEAIQAIAQAAKSQATSAAQIMRLMEQMAKLMQQSQANVPVAAVSTAQISIWEEDPFSEEAATLQPPLATTIAVPIPANDHPLLQTRILDPAAAPGPFDPGTREFRFWVASEALARGINFWAPLLPTGTRWTTFSSPMQVRLLDGVDLNAFFTRTTGLHFFQQVVRGVTISSAESADVVCHELGHAILDALRPQLFNAASLEVAAFHEGFGDMSGILCALQLPSLRQKVLSETGGRLNINSRLSRLAEQLGWGIRQGFPSAVDRDCLRNAANAFFFRNPSTLPPSAPATSLSSEPHSFSRVFTGAFLEALANMLPIAGGGDQGLLQASQDMGRLLVDGVRTATIVPRYYSQVAAAMIQAEQGLFGGRYRAALNRAFVRRGILATGAAARLADAPAPQMAAGLGNGDGHVTYGDEDNGFTRTAADAPELPTRAVETALGLTIEVHAAVEKRRFSVTSAAVAGQEDAETPESDAASFVEDLIQNGRIDWGAARGVADASIAAVDLPGPDETSLKTHTLARGDDGTLVLKRLIFNCGLHGCQHRH